jgi:ABC-type transport system involved in multi-copper enzyme maturation permease subunit
MTSPTDAMSDRHRPARHVWLFAANMVGNALRGGAGILFFVATLLTGLITAQAILGPIEAISVQARKEGGQADDATLMRQLTDAAKPAITWALGGSNPIESTPANPISDQHKRAQQWATYLLDERPAALSAIFLLFTYFLPLLVALGGFNQIAGDIASRRLRYLLTRAKRSDIYTGRALGTFLFTVSCLALSLAIIGCYVAFRIPFYSATAVLSWTFTAWLMLSILAIPYVALCSWISASIASSFGSLAVIAAIMGGVPVLAWAASRSHQSLSVLHWLLPYPFQHQLFHHLWSNQILAMVGCLAYGAIFFVLGLWLFKREDL